MIDRKRNFVRRILKSLRRRVRDALSNLAVRSATRMISGTCPVVLAEDECCVVVLLKNAEYYLPELLAHHRAIGVKHFLIIDNGSTDRTLEIATAAADVTVVENHLPVGTYEIRLRSELAKRFVRGGWFLFVDADELHDPPPGCGGKITPLLRYLRENGYTAVLSHYLDMFSDHPVEETVGWSYAEAIANCVFYSLDKLEWIDYRDPPQDLHYFLAANRTDSALGLWRGGVRQEVFGERPLLTRHAIIRNAPGIVPLRHVHATSGVSVADVTLSFRHYKFAGDYVARDRQQVLRGVWTHGEDRKRLAVYDRPGGFTISSPTQRRYRGVEALEEEGFIQRSGQFCGFLLQTGDSVPNQARSSSPASSAASPAR